MNSNTEIIARHQNRAEEEASLRDWFTKMLGSEDDANELMNRCERLEVAEGDIVVRAGDHEGRAGSVCSGEVTESSTRDQSWWTSKDPDAFWQKPAVTSKPPWIRSSPAPIVP